MKTTEYEKKIKEVSVLIKELYDSNKDKDFDLPEYGEMLTNLFNEVGWMLAEKRQDYGNSFSRVWDRTGALSAIARMWDKMERLTNLFANEKEPQNESIEDALKDLIGYSVLSLLKLRGQLE